MARSVFMTVTRRAGVGGTCWASVQTIAANAGCNPKTARKWLHWLTSKGWLLADQRPGRATHYHPQAVPGVYAPPVNQCSKTPTKIGRGPYLFRETPLPKVVGEGNPVRQPPKKTQQQQPPKAASTHKSIEPVVVVGSDFEKDSDKPDYAEKADVLASFGIVGSTLDELASSLLTAKEIRRQCEKTKAGGGGGGATVNSLRSLVSRKVEKPERKVTKAEAANVANVRFQKGELGPEEYAAELKQLGYDPAVEFERLGIQQQDNEAAMKKAKEIEAEQTQLAADAFAGDDHQAAAARADAFVGVPY